MMLRILAKGWQKLEREYALKVLPVYNRFVFKGLGANFKGHCLLMGRCLFSTGRNSLVVIGNNFRLVSTSYANPLCRNRARISVSDNAVLTIGDNVGMSSPTIWVRKSIRIGSHVNLGGG